MAMTYIKQASQMKQPSMERPGCNAFLGDVMVSDDADKTIVSGFFRMEKSDEPLVYEYTYHEMKIIVEGEMTISDEEGNEVVATAGDIFYFPKGSVITFQSSDYGIGFFCGQRREGEG
ncbi:Ethanolamine utilisation protein EutQ [Amphritea atlantica]|uniref:Ethanolamine utilisation protein EutQ n=1 Tax=Amphritea atlantica TaxID=355243 RepID=A0A1H9D807_9GAMM|nr:cupin domain-containing protein [Amphritea atlantica]SEQ09590.1 Ethanolamine utilisation protein EutQ [Amphritea atlantica]